MSNMTKTQILKLASVYVALALLAGVGCNIWRPSDDETQTQRTNSEQPRTLSPRTRTLGEKDAYELEQKGLTPPRVASQSPFRLFQFITAIPAVGVTFDQSVTGVAAGDLTVNGSPATGVTGSNQGPYNFTGFTPPVLGPVAVNMRTGNIQNFDGEVFPGGSWGHTLIDPALDSDNDGVNDGDEANLLLIDPTNPDTDGDGLPDGFEVANSCLDPSENEAHPQDYGEPNSSPGNNDADADGLSNLQEFEQGSDPCSSDPR